MLKSESCEYGSSSLTIEESNGKVLHSGRLHLILDYAGKYLLGTNALAYLTSSLVTRKNVFKQ
jgi:hypothetical protein